MLLDTSSAVVASSTVENKRVLGVESVIVSVRTTWFKVDDA